MTLKEFEKLRADTAKEFAALHNKALALKASGEVSFSKYQDIGVEHLMVVKYERTCDLEDVSIKTMLKEIEELNETFKLLNAIEKEKPYQEIDTGECYIHSFNYEFKYRDICSKAELEARIKTKVKENVRIALKPKGYEGYTIHVDCKLLTLFKDGSIDWKTLQKLVYTNCEL